MLLSMLVSSSPRFLACTANFNDRSMLGDRDSELGLVVKDNHRVDGRMDGNPVQVGQFAQEFRFRLWQVSPPPVSHGWGDRLKGFNLG